MSRPWYLRQSSPGDGSTDTGKAGAPTGAGRTRHRLAPVRTCEEVLPHYRDTAVEDLLAYHNLGRPFRFHAQAEMLIAMCMDHRKMLRIPENFAFILRTGGGNLRRIEFKLSYAIAIGGVRAVCLIAHNHCGMVELSRRVMTLSVAWWRTPVGTVGKLRCTSTLPRRSSRSATR